MLYKTSQTFIIVKRFDYHDCLGKIRKESKNVYRSYKIFIASIHFTEIIKIFKQRIIHYINKPLHWLTIFSGSCMFRITVDAVY